MCDVQNLDGKKAAKPEQVCNAVEKLTPTKLSFFASCSTLRFGICLIMYLCLCLDTDRTRFVASKPKGFESRMTMRKVSRCRCVREVEDLSTDFSNFEKSSVNSLPSYSYQNRSLHSYVCHLPVELFTFFTPLSFSLDSRDAWSSSSSPSLDHENGRPSNENRRDRKYRRPGGNLRPILRLPSLSLTSAGRLSKTSEAYRQQIIQK